MELKKCITTATTRWECRIWSRPGSVGNLEYKKKTAHWSKRQKWPKWNETVKRKFSPFYRFISFWSFLPFGSVCCLYFVSLSLYPQTGHVGTCSVCWMWTCQHIGYPVSEHNTILCRCPGTSPRAPVLGHQVWTQPKATLKTPVQVLLWQSSTEPPVPLGQAVWWHWHESCSSTLYCNPLSPVLTSDASISINISMRNLMR